VLNREVPFLRIGVPICLGIVSGHYFKPGYLFLVISLIIAISGFAISLFFNKKLINNIYGYTLSCSLFLCGILLYTIEKKNLSELEPVPSIFLCSLSEYPEEKNNNLSFIVRLHSMIGKDGKTQIKGSMLIRTKKDSSIIKMVPGDLLRIRCVPVPVVNRGNPYEFDYRFYMENRGIKYSGYISAGDISGHISPAHRKLVHKALIIRNRIIEMYEDRGIKGDRLALVAAIILGQKNMLDPEQKQIFMKAGVMHIMAVSGLHAVVLSVFIFNLLFFMKKRFNTFRILITVVLLWGFAFVTGMTPSVLRATLMFSFLQTGNLMKRNVSSLNSVLASAVILMVMHPSVIFDAGFLLSYSSVIFIICFYRNMYLKIRFKRWIADKLWQSATVTIIAQTGTLPLTVSLFNRFPTWFILTNIVIVPLSSLLIIIGCLVPLTYPLKFISRPLASLLGLLAGFTELLTEKATSLPLSTIEKIGLIPSESLLFFFVVFLVVAFLLGRQSIPIRYPLFLVFIFICFGTIRSISDKSSAELIVYNTAVPDIVGVRTGKVLNLYGDTSKIPQEVIRHCSARGFKIKRGSSVEPVLILDTGKSRILISNYLNNELLSQAQPDYVILTGDNPEMEKMISATKRVKTLIITNKKARIASRFSWRSDYGIIDSVHFIKNSGVYRARL